MSAQLSTITSKGQITIPKNIRDSLHLLNGDKVEFIRNEANEIIIKPITKKSNELAGMLNQYAKKDPVSIEDMELAIAGKLKKKYSK